MNNLTSEIITYLKTKTFSYSNVSIVQPFNASTNVYPKIVVRQMFNSTAVKTNMEEKVSNIAFQIELYAKDTKNTAGTVKGRDSVLTELASEVDGFIQSKYGFYRYDCTEVMELTSDVAVLYLRYSGSIDDSGYIYKSLYSSVN